MGLGQNGDGMGMGIGHNGDGMGMGMGSAFPPRESWASIFVMVMF